MSVEALIAERGKLCDRRRPVYGRTPTYGVAIVAEETATIRVYVQVNGGGTGVKYGAERSGYSATGYCAAGTDVLDGDLIDYTDDTGQLRKYRIDSRRVPDERSVSQSLSYIILGLTEDRQVSA